MKEKMEFIQNVYDNFGNPHSVLILKTKSGKIFRYGNRDFETMKAARGYILNCFPSANSCFAKKKR